MEDRERREVSEAIIEEGKWFTREEFYSVKDDNLVHSDMRKVYELVLKDEGLSLDTIKKIGY